MHYEQIYICICIRICTHIHTHTHTHTYICTQLRCVCDLKHKKKTLAPSSTADHERMISLFVFSSPTHKKRLSGRGCTGPSHLITLVLYFVVGCISTQERASLLCPLPPLCDKREQRTECVVSLYPIHMNTCAGAGVYMRACVNYDMNQFIKD